MSFPVTKRYFLNFRNSDTGLTPTFVFYKNAATFADIVPQPARVEGEQRRVLLRSDVDDFDGPRHHLRDRRRRFDSDRGSPVHQGDHQPARLLRGRSQFG